jgi:hypothetical protein
MPAGATSTRIASAGSIPSSRTAFSAVPLLRGPLTIASKKVGDAGQLDRGAAAFAARGQGDLLVGGAQFADPGDRARGDRRRHRVGGVVEAVGEVEADAGDDDQGDDDVSGGHAGVPARGRGPNVKER